MENLHTNKTSKEVILVGRLGKCQSIKKVGGRRFAEGLYQALFSFSLAPRECYLQTETKIEPDIRLQF